MGGTATGYLQYWEKGKYRAEILRLAALAFEKQNKPKKAEQYRRQLIRENEDQSPGIIGRLDEARQLYYDRKYIDAQKICRRLGNSKLDEAAAGALYMLSFYSLEQKRVDDAILYYNLLRERYPVAVGLNALVNGLSQIERGTTDRRAEKITGTVYSVKVGVFSKKDNAKKMAKRMEKFGEKVEIKQKPISDKKYHVVYVGRFQSMEKAMAFKARLESSENEAYQVVAR
jgi:tetratricopeptide (TPR) repeat protein